MSFLNKVRASYLVVAAQKIPMFETENDTDFWVVAVDGFFGTFKTKPEADRVYDLIGGEGGDDLGDTPFGSAQQLEPAYKPKAAKAKISDFKPINIEDYIKKQGSRARKNSSLTKQKKRAQQTTPDRLKQKKQQQAWENFLK